MSWHRKIRVLARSGLERVIYPSPNPARCHPYLAEPSYYRLGYQLSAQLLHRELASSAEPRKADREDAPGRPGASEARETAERVLTSAERMLRWYRSREQAPARRFWIRGLRPVERRLMIFLSATVTPCLELVIAAARPGEKEGKGIHLDDLRWRASAGELSYRATYNLACYEASEVGATRRALAYLESAFLLAPVERRDDLLEWARKDPSLAKLHDDPGFEALRKTFANPA